VIIGVYRTLGASGVKALLLLLLAPTTSFRGRPLYSISIFSSTLVRSAYLDIVYVAIGPITISRVFINRSALGEYLCWYKRVPSGLAVGIFLGKG